MLFSQDICSANPDLSKRQSTIVEDASLAAHTLEIPHKILDVREAFKENVIDCFASSYAKGETPNPCVNCNRFIKFPAFFEFAQKNGIGKIATGHYARNIFNAASGRYELLKAKDRFKDQSYMLWTLSQKILANVIFPLSEMTKDDVRSIAQTNGLINPHKRESQDICFVPDGNYVALLRNTLETLPSEGYFVDSKGKILGKNKGILHYTVGQRRGLGISSDNRLYVLSVDPKTNTVVLGQEHELYRSSFDIGDVNFISVENIYTPTVANVKTRYSKSAVPITLYPQTNRRFHIVFDSPQKGVTPGQSAVFYINEAVLGGGIILREDAPTRI